MKLGNDPQSALVLTPLEKSVLQALAEGLGQAGSVLQDQIRKLRVVYRSHSGVGFVTRLEAAEEVPGLPPGVASGICAVYASHPQLREPAEFMVQLKSGRLASIEAFCGEGMWPADETGFRVESVKVAPGH